LLNQPIFCRHCKKTEDGAVFFFRLNVLPGAYFMESKYLRVFIVICEELYVIHNKCDGLTLHSVAGIPRIPDNISNCEARL